MGFGYVASSHIDTILSKLENYRRGDGKKKESGGLFSSFLKDSKSSDSDVSKSTIILAYAYVTLYSPKDLILSRLEANILRTLSEYAEINTKVNLKRKPTYLLINSTHKLRK